MTYLSLKMWHRLICDLSILQVLSHFPPKVLPDHHMFSEQGQRSGAGVSCREGLLTRYVLPLHRLLQVWPWSCVRSCRCAWSLFRCLPRLLQRTCPCKLCFKTAPGPGGCMGSAGSGGLLWDPGGIQPAGMCCAAGNLGRNVGGVGGRQGILRS